MKIISKEKPKIVFDEKVFVDHSIKNRSGHLGHAMVECKDGSILAFYSNTSGTHNHGHTMFGWVEYKRSNDRGITWSAPKVLDYAYEMFIDGTYRIGCEKAVVCDDGTIVLFCLRSIGPYFEPYATPVCLISKDNGNSWSEPIAVSDERGRIYDAIYRNGRIYVLEFCNSTDKGFTCNEEGKFYKLFASDDCGSTFYEYSVIPFNTLDHAYGNIIFRQDGSLVFYGYTVKDEFHLTSLISNDSGLTWSKPFKVAVAKIARNPQVGFVNGHYFLHGRSIDESGKCGNLVVYHSKDAIHWDEGTIVTDLLDGQTRGGYYSNNLTIRGKDGVDRLLIQYSEDYALPSGRVNIMHAFVEVEE